MTTISPENLDGGHDQKLPSAGPDSDALNKAYEQQQLKATADALDTTDPAAKQRIKEIKDKLGIHDKPENDKETQKNIKYAEKVLSAFGKLEQLMYERYGKDAFHNLDHVREFEEAGLDILATIKKIDPSFVTEDDELAISAIARGHDIVVNYLLNTDPTSFQYGQRMRLRGWKMGDIPPNVKDAVGTDEYGNEKESANETVKILQEVDPDDLVFKQTTYDKIWDGIAATYPEAGMAPIPEEYLTIKVSEDATIDLRSVLVQNKDGQYIGLKFNQKYLTPDSSITTLAGGLADLSYVGKVTPEQFRQSGNAEYRELRELIGSELKLEIAAISPERKVQIAADMLMWIDSQVGFALHQKIRFNDVISSNKAINENPHAEQIKTALIGKYSLFDTNIIASKERALGAREKYVALKNAVSYPDSDGLFAELAREMGYEI